MDLDPQVSSHCLLSDLIHSRNDSSSDLAAENKCSHHAGSEGSLPSKEPLVGTPEGPN